MANPHLRIAITSPTNGASIPVHPPDWLITVSGTIDVFEVTRVNVTIQPGTGRAWPSVPVTGQGAWSCTGPVPLDPVKIVASADGDTTDNPDEPAHIQDEDDITITATDNGTRPTLEVQILSATAQQQFVGPGGSVTFSVHGTAIVTEGDGQVVDKPTIEVSCTGGTTQTVGVAHDGLWSCTGSATRSGTFTITAVGSVAYTYFGSRGTLRRATTADVTVPLDDAPPGVAASLPNGPTYGVPTPGSTLPVLVSWSAQDDKSGVDRVGVGLAPNNLSWMTQQGAKQVEGTTTVDMPAILGNHTMYVQAVDKVGNSSTPTALPLMLVDTAAPVVTVSVPSAPFLYDDSPITVPVSGTVIDTQSGAKWVKVTLWDGGQMLKEQEATLSDPHGPNQLATWNTTLEIPAPGNYTVSVHASDNNVPSPNITPSPYTAPVLVVPIPEPVPRITSHQDGDVIPGTEQGADVTISGTASATYSTLTVVEVSIDNGGYQRANPDTPDWAQWSAQVHIPAQGSHTITARCTNSARHPERKYGSDTVTLTVGVAYKPQDIEDNISLLAYFKDLLEFTTKRLTITDGTGTHHVTLADLTQQFHQPFDTLQTDEEVQQIRICVEVLRGYLAAINTTLDPTAEARYCEAAYQALLIQFGTSYDELRRIRRADLKDRQALAARLGLDLDSDQLGQLFLTPDHITEANLERIFGLVDTTHDPLASTDLPLLFKWQMDHLRALWWQQDHPASPSVAPSAPIIDPDIVSPQECKPGNASALWQSRHMWVSQRLQQLLHDRQPGESDDARFDRLVGQAIHPATMTELLTLEEQRQQGHDITAQLAPYSLSLPAFACLMHLRSVPANSALLDAEWADVYAILVQVLKLRQYDSWRGEETGLTLGPDAFTIVADTPQLPAWRATWQARQAWQDTLQGRMNQEETTRHAFLAAVSTAEAVALPILRDALVASVSTETNIDVANWLTQRLMIDMQGSSALKTTRLTQAIETVQGILTAIRTGRFMEMDSQIAPLPPGMWALTEPQVPPSDIGMIFDQEWTWMGTFASWRAAMRIFLYPDNLLLPSLRQDTDMTEAFQDMVTVLRVSQQITPHVAHERVGVYLAAAVDNNTQIRDALNALHSNWKADTFVLDESLEEVDLPKRADAIKDLLMRNNGTQPLQRYMAELFYFVPMQLALQLHQAGQYTAALDWFRTVYGYNLPTGQRKVYYGLKQEEEIPSVYQTTDQWLRTTLNPHDIAPMRTSVFTRFTLISIVRCFLDYADSEFASESGEAIARARTLYLSALDLLDSADMLLPNGGGDPAVAFGFAPNPEPLALRQHAELNLFKLRNGRNIAGMQLQVMSYASHNRTLISEASATSSLRPTSYRYATLVERAKQLVTLAQQMEERYLSALEKRDAETYNMLKARQDLGLTQATLQLQDLRVIEANDGVALATLQQSRAQTQQNTYQEWIDKGPIQAEKDLLQNYKDANFYRNLAAVSDAALTVAQTFTQSDKGFLGIGLGLSIAGTLLVGALAGGRATAQVAANNAETRAQTSSFWASYERRQQEWQLQYSLARKDVAIGQQQFVQAQDHQRIVGQERLIAQMQANSAQATVDFLAHKFTGPELYLWMSGILGRVYSYFLQQATAVARLAQNQLAFERQEKPPAVIRADYWQAPTETATAGNTADGSRDRRGLTGSARLLQDIYQLDQYAFETNKRKLQLSKTISLAQLAPIEFQTFRQTGVLPFTTSMALFDWDFPGHYLRMIRRVRTSVIALIPPHQGIHATLTTTGLSRVMIANGGFRDVVVRRDPELVALTSPLNATGLFELDVQSELLLPFEGMGVDTSWELQMPRAANRFDYRTIADVLITIEYTALHSFDYRQQVIQGLHREISADRPFSFRQQFPDQWYDLHNPDQSVTPMTVTFETGQTDFPPNLEEMTIQHLVLYVVPTEGESFQLGVMHLQLTRQNKEKKTVVLGAGDATPVDGVISTRSGSGRGWDGMRGKAPCGEWVLRFPAKSVRDGVAVDTKALFSSAAIDDILFVITYSGRTPAWPM